MNHPSDEVPHMDPQAETVLRVTGGGDPTPEQMAALVVALTPVAAAAADDRAPTRSGWLRAALVEGVGARRARSVQDVVPLP